MTGQKRLIKFPYALRKYFRNMHFLLHQMSISQFTENYLPEYMTTQEKSVIIILQKEWVLNGATVIYGSASELRKTLEYDFMKEKHYSYKGLSMDEIIHHLAVFVANLWQIHIFGEGNTRTTAVFFIKYLRTLGFDATNDIFAENAWYFRNALVRANYNDLKHEIHETTEYLELFLRNLLLDEKIYYRIVLCMLIIRKCL